MLLLVAVVFRPHLQQRDGHWWLQERRPVRHQQEEPDVVQGLPSAQVPPGGDVQERLPLRQTLQLVQNPLPAAGADGIGRSPGRRRRRRRTQFFVV